MARLFSTVRLRRGLFAAGLCVALSACENPWFEDAPSLDTVLSKGWLFAVEQLEPARRTAPPVYCYQTIGVSDCFDQPLEGGGHRLVGFEGPAPEIDPPSQQP